MSAAPAAPAVPPPAPAPAPAEILPAAPASLALLPPRAELPALPVLPPESRSRNGARSALPLHATASRAAPRLNIVLMRVHSFVRHAVVKLPPVVERRGFCAAAGRRKHHGHQQILLRPRRSRLEQRADRRRATQPLIVGGGARGRGIWNWRRRRVSVSCVLLGLHREGDLRSGRNGRLPFQEAPFG